VLAAKDTFIGDPPLLRDPLPYRPHYLHWNHLHPLQICRRLAQLICPDLGLVPLEQTMLMWKISLLSC
jgi:hypothetical protein